MRRAWMMVAAAALAGCTPEATAPATCDLQFSDDGEVRVFVVGHKVDLKDSATYADFHDSFRRHMERIKSCFSSARPNLVVFPEDAGLVALLMGPRGAIARKLRSSGNAFISVAAFHADGIAYYQSRYPGISVTRSLLLSASDGVWRAMQETFGGLANEYGVWVLTSANVGDMEETTAARRATWIRDPSIPPWRPAYLAVTPNVYNAGLLYAPDGTLAGRSNKVFLTDPEEQTLDLSNGDLTTVPVLETPFARIGVAISRDAFYAPYMQRMEDLDVDLIVQPEAFSGWAVGQNDADEWLPDVFLSSAWLHMQKYRTFRFSLIPQLTGNFFDLVFDGQVHIAKRMSPADTPMAYVGQQPLKGFLNMGPWVMDDPGGSLSVADRRAQLRARGEELLPSSKSRRRNEYIDSVVAADLRLPSSANAAPIAFARDEQQPLSVAIDAAAGHQRRADIASDGDARAVIVWQDTRGGRPAIHGASTANSGATFQALGPVAVSVEEQRNPAVCMRGPRVMGVWQEGVAGSERIRYAVTDNAGQAFSASLAVVPDAAHAQWDADCGFISDTQALVAWTDFASGVGKIRVSLVDAAARTVSAPVAADATTDGLPRLNGSQAQVAVSSEGGHLAWLDYREHSWDVQYAKWTGGAVTTSKRVDDAGSSERLHGEPDIAASGTRVVVVYSDLHHRRGSPDIGYAVSDDSGETWTFHRAIPGGRDESGHGLANADPGNPRVRPSVAVDGNTMRVVFQDHSVGKSAVFASTIDGGGVAGAPVRVDDTADAAVGLTRPGVARVRDGFVTVWEDERDGPFRIYGTAD